MKKIIFFFIIISILITSVFLNGCTEITGFVVENTNITLPDSQSEKDVKLVTEAIESSDYKKCYYIQTKVNREYCFLELAKILSDPSVCDNLINPKKSECKSIVG